MGVMERDYQDRRGLIALRMLIKFRMICDEYNTRTREGEGSRDDREMLLKS